MQHHRIFKGLYFEVKLHLRHTKPFLLFCLLAGGLSIYGQDSSAYFKSLYNLDSLLSPFEIQNVHFRFQPEFNYLDRDPQPEDQRRYKKYRHLIGQQPTKRNYKNYSILGASLWELGKIREAEQIFLAILGADLENYDSTYYHSSDVPGDTVVNSYGYGSYTSSYKNNAAVYMTKICLEQKQYARALLFLEAAVKKYSVYFSCGTGRRAQQEKYYFLYGACYNGLKRYNETIDLLLPSCMERDDQLIITAIRETYSPEAIRNGLQLAEASIVCSFDSLPSYGFITMNRGTEEEKTDTITYYSGSATMRLFGRELQLPVPYLGNGERLERDMFVKYFKESHFYISLASEPYLIRL